MNEINNENIPEENPDKNESEIPEDNTLSNENTVSDVKDEEKALSDNIESDLNKDSNNESDTGSDNRFQEYFYEKTEDYIPKMTEILLTYYDLKNIDEELTEIEEEKGDLPEKIKSIKNKLKLNSKELDEKKESLLKLDSEKNQLTEDNLSYEERISKYDEQKYDVRSNNEYDDIVKTIESLFDEVKKNDTRIKEVVSIYESLSKDTENLESKINELNEELTEKQTLLDELDEQYKQDESGLKEKRSALISKLDDKDANIYERINNSYKGEAIAIVRRGNCSGCYNSIPPQRVIEIRSAEKIFTCQSCGRILISDEMLESREN